MGNFYLLFKQTPKKVFLVFVALLLIFTMCISCTTTSEEGINDNRVTKEVDGEVVIDDEDEEHFGEFAGELTLAVRDKNTGRSVENAEVIFAGEVGYTDQAGIVSFPNIEAGVYKLEVNAEGFLGYNYEDIVIDDSILHYRAQLQPTKKYEILYSFTSDAEQIWTPVPVNWDGHGTIDIEILEINPEPKILYTDEHGNQIAYWHDASITKADYFIKFIIEVSEIKHNVSNYSIEYDQDSEVYQAYTSSKEMTQSDDPRIINKAEEIIKDTVDPLEKAKKIADWVSDNLQPGDVTYMYPDAITVLDYKKGHCGAFANIFTTLCRASGIPARNVSVLHHPYKNEFQSGKHFEGFYAHIISEFYLQDYGWVQIDPINNSIGNIQEDLIIMSKGNSFMLKEASFNEKHLWFHLPMKNRGGQIEDSIYMEVKRLDHTE